MVRHLAALLFMLAPHGVPRPAPTLPPAFVPPPILMYHRVDVDQPRDRVGRELTVSPQQFAEQLAYLKAHGITGISMEELRQRLESGAPLDHVVVLTFDDGYADQYTYAYPLLREYRDAATFYIVTGALDGRRHLSWTQVESLHAAGEDIAAHGLAHADLTLMSSAQQAKQIDDSVRVLERRLHAAVTSYGYPSGRFNRTTLTLVHGAGIDFAVTTDRTYVIGPENRFEIPRLRVRSDWSIAQFARALQTAIERSQIVRR